MSRRRRRKSRLTGYETGLGDYMKNFTERLWCDRCNEEFDIVDRDRAPLLMLSCGHKVTREGSIEDKEKYDLHMDIGYPNPSGGFFFFKGYPGPNEMEVKIKMYPELVERVRKYLGKPEWKP